MSEEINAEATTEEVVANPEVVTPDAAEVTKAE